MMMNASSYRCCWCCCDVDDDLMVRDDYAEDAEESRHTKGGWCHHGKIGSVDESKMMMKMILVVVMSYRLIESEIAMLLQMTMMKGLPLMTMTTIAIVASLGDDWHSMTMRMMVGH